MLQDSKSTISLRKILITMSSQHNLAISLQVLIKLLSTRQTVATASRSFSNPTSIDSPTIKQHIFYK
jgi:hypothetical protein